MRIRPHSKPLPWLKAKYESMAFLSSASTFIRKLFLFSFFWPEFIPVHCEKKRSYPKTCRKRIKMEIPFKASGLEHGTPARNRHRECRSISRVCSETVGCFCAIEPVRPVLHGGSGARCCLCLVHMWHFHLLSVQPITLW